MVTETDAADDLEFYRTPEWATSKILRRLAREVTPTRILEPCAGDGAMLGPLRAAWPSATIDAYDIQSRHPAVVQRPFWFDDTPQRYELLFTNPPFSVADHFINYGWTRLVNGGLMVMLLRITFFESAERLPIFRKQEPDVYIEPHRIPFRNGKTDSAGCAWFVWQQGRRRPWGRLEHLF